MRKNIRKFIKRRKLKEILKKLHMQILKDIKDFIMMKQYHLVIGKKLKEQKKERIPKRN